MSGNSVSRAQRRFLARRKVLPGFPKNDPFESIGEVREYFSGDKVVCLLCGKEYKRIGFHVEKIHSLTMNDYKQKYKIPWTYGLICDESSERYRDSMKRRISEGFAPPIKTGEDHKLMVATTQRVYPFKREVAIQNSPFNKE